MRLDRPIGSLLLGVLVVAGTATTATVTADKPARGHGVAGGKPAQPPPSQPAADVSGVSGAYTFRTHCAGCHGPDGKGEGPLAENLRYHPRDLTLIASRNGGSFPTEKVVRIVDGRDPVKGHGGPDMPVWGDAFKNADTGYDDKQVREKIRSVVEYLRTIQAK
jgi:mono/diheme cytochrome c family protein